MKVYTRKGDDGSTGLIGGTRVPKDHVRIEAYGTVDELNSHIGQLRDSAPAHGEFLIWVQNRLFTIGSLLAEDTGKSKMKLPQLKGDEQSILEAEIDRIENGLPEMRNFVLPGGHPAVSQAHVARCVCRRAERRAYTLSTQMTIAEDVIPFLNRLSDYLFMLSRRVGFDEGAEETPWIPEM
jgi:cob(I)alamin adenosyltransferase